MVFRAASLILLLCAAPALAEGDAARGAQLFAKCKACHTIEQGGAHKMGPNLYGVIGRRAGATDFPYYSPAMTYAGYRGLVWDEQTFIAFNQNPTRFMLSITQRSNVKTNKTFKVPNIEELLDIYAYVAQIGPNSP